MDEKKDLQAVAARCRKRIISMIYKANAGHPGGSLSIADIITVIFQKYMTKDKNGKDKFILSKGHAVPALYAILCEKGLLDEGLLSQYRAVDSPLEGHPWTVKLPNAIDATTGLLGQGLSVGMGMALAKKRNKDPHRVFVAVGDGEIEVGQFWEAAMFAPSFELENLVCIIDRNGFSSHGKVTVPEPLADKMQSFGWHCISIDGHDFDAIIDALDPAQTKKHPKRPLCIIAKTVKGKGVPYMENNPAWHSKGLSDDEYKSAMAALGEVV